MCNKELESGEGISLSATRAPDLGSSLLLQVPEPEWKHGTYQIPVVPVVNDKDNGVLYKDGDRMETERVDGVESNQRWRREMRDRGRVVRMDVRYQSPLERWRGTSERRERGRRRRRNDGRNEPWLCHEYKNRKKGRHPNGEAKRRSHILYTSRSSAWKERFDANAVRWVFGSLDWPTQPRVSTPSRYS